MEEISDFEFDLSDVDVAAFESVATEVTADTTQEQQQPQLQNQHPQPQQQQHPIPAQPPPIQTQIQPQQTQHHAALPTSADTPAARKVLLVPINSKAGAPGLKQLFQIQQLYFTTNNSPLKPQQTSSLGAVLNKSIDNITNNVPIASHLASANLPTRTVSFNDSLRTSTPAPNIANDMPKRKPCNCTKSQCLKLYCDCFANGEFCSGCNCTNCFNSLSKEKERQQAITQCLERNPEAFRPKIGKAVKQRPDSIERRHTKGCNCKRSGCLKNYCECYEAKILCSNLCKCCGCKNYEESFERKTLIQLSNSSPENARGILKSLLPTDSGSNSGRSLTKCLVNDKIIHASLICLLKSAQQAEKDGIPGNEIPDLLQMEMGKCLRMIVDTAESSSPKKRKSSG